MALRDKNAILCTVVFFSENLAVCSRNGARPNGFQRKLYAIHIEMTVFHRHRIAGERDDTFNPKFTAVIWICEQNEVAALRVSIPVGIFYCNEAVTRRYGRIHGCTGNAEGLDKSVADVERIAQETAGAHQQE